MGKIYCDESGYTGTDLLDNDQEYFVYSGIMMSEKVIQEIVNYIHSNYAIQNSEIKGKYLVKRSRGRALISNIFAKYASYARIVLHNKKYALAAKIVDYSIEPYLGANEYFYKSKMNVFLATSLYFYFVANDATAQALFTEYLRLLRGEISFEDSMFITDACDGSLMNWVIDIATHNPKVIIDEIGSKNQVEWWILDLTVNSLHGILSDWGKYGEELEVICDVSDVFQDNPLLVAVNRVGTENMISDNVNPVIQYKLTKEIATGDSKEDAGLQIADLFSSVAFYCLKNQNTVFGKEILSVLQRECLCTPNDYCLLPNVSFSQDEVENFHRAMKVIYENVKGSRTTE